MLLRQLYDHESFTCSYLLAAEASGGAVPIDPADVRHDRYLRLLRELELTPIAALETHVRANQKNQG